MNQKATPAASHLTWTGISLIVLGAIAIALPAVAGGAAMVVVGGVFVVTGVVQIVQGFREEGGANKLLHFVLGVIAIIAGGMVLAHPYLGLATLTLVLAIVLVFEGIYKVIAAFSYRPANGWGWLLVSGIITFILGGLIWKQWPLSALWVVGVLIGVNLVCTGMAMVVFAYALREYSKAVEAVAAGQPEQPETPTS